MNNDITKEINAIIEKYEKAFGIETKEDGELLGEIVKSRLVREVSKRIKDKEVN